MQSRTGKFVTLAGLPLHIELSWPFQPSASGADWYVLHGSVRLDDGGPLRADLAVHMTQTIRALIPSTDGEIALAITVNTIRKALDDMQLELLRTGKRQPCPLSSRQYNIRGKHWWFQKATDAQITDYLRRKIYWLGVANANDPVSVADPVDCMYLGAGDPNIADRFRVAAKALAAEGQIALTATGEYASPTSELVASAVEITAEKDGALEALMAKHAFESAKG